MTYDTTVILVSWWDSFIPQSQRVSWLNCNSDLLKDFWNFQQSIFPKPRPPCHGSNKPLEKMILVPDLLTSIPPYLTGRGAEAEHGPIRWSWTCCCRVAASGSEPDLASRHSASCSTRSASPWSNSCSWEYCYSGWNQEALWWIHCFVVASGKYKVTSIHWELPLCSNWGAWAETYRWRCWCSARRRFQYLSSYPCLKV